MNANDRPIAFLDSGVGGLPYLAMARDKLPNDSFVYLADRAGFPYGPKPASVIIDNVRSIVDRLMKKTEPKALVIACNTASQLTLEILKAEYPGFPIVGTIPAVKPAAELSKAGVIGVVATQSTVTAPFFDELVKSKAGSCKVLRRGDPVLVDFIEKRFLASSKEERLAAVKPAVDSFLSDGADVIVLACTHFLHVYKEFVEMAGSKALIVDSREGVSKRLVELLAASYNSPAEKHLTAQKEKLPDRMFLTGPAPFEPIYQGFAKAFNLQAAGSI
ncbi:glutamate racemase [Spirochaetota bacterium]